MFAKRVLSLTTMLVMMTGGSYAADVVTPPILLDTQYIKQFEAPDAFDSEDKVKAFRREANARMDALKRAFDEASDRCLKAFFVERCVDEHKVYYLERTREIRAQLKRAGDSLLRIRQEEKEATPKANMGQGKPGEVHLLTNPVPESKPEGLPRLVKEAPKPLSASEEARNEQAFYAKQAEARRRIEEAQAKAQARRASRIEKREALEAKLRAREEEQKRFEARQKSGDPAGLKRYFQGE